MSIPTTKATVEDLDLDALLADLDELIEQATSNEDEGDGALAIRSISW